MKISSIAGAGTNTRNTKLEMVTQAAAGTNSTASAASVAMRPTTLPPPPRSSSFGGADPRAMFEALVQSFDNDGDGKLSLDEVNALNQGGLLSRSFARIDRNADGKISGDEISGLLPWNSGMLPTRDDGSQSGTNLRPLIETATDPHSPDFSSDSVAGFSRPDNGATFDGAANNLPPSRLASVFDPAFLRVEPASMMQSMVQALSVSSGTDDGAAAASFAKPAIIRR